MESEKEGMIMSLAQIICCLVLLQLILCITGFNVRLTTTARNPLQNSVALQDYLSRPVHWPEIVLSSDKVESNTSFNVENSMQPGQSVDELFGMGLLRVSWICSDVQPGRFVVKSFAGVTGIANNCTMEFDIQDDNVDLTMGFTPVSLLAYLSIPALVVDNWLALNMLLPAAIDPAPLNSFRKLMGVLYGFAGLAHTIDIWLGDSALFTSFDLPRFVDLSMEGQAYAVLWCVVGPLSYLMSHTSNGSKRLGDLGIFIYGFVEVLGAILSGNQHAWTNAIGVQIVVILAWVFSNQKQESKIVS